MQPPPLPPVSHPVPQRKTAGLAIASLVLGILSMFCGTFITGIPAIILGIIALVRIGKTPGLGGQGLAIAGLVTGGVGSVFMTAIIVAIMLPAFANVRSKANEIACASKVKMLCVASIAFAQEHDNTLPKTLDDLRPHLGDDQKMFDLFTRCPSATGAPRPGYRIEHAGEKTTSLPATTPVIVETECRHRGKRTVGYLDGHVECRAAP
jgi:prepilin-type processing-associated H-X9-DG protein